MWLEPIVLTGKHVSLEPFQESHTPELWEVGQSPDIWKYIPFRVESENDLGKLVERGIEMTAAGVAVAFAQRSIADNRIVGGTGYWNADPEHRRLEIGFTWLSPPWQRTAINTEAKYLLLTHAFDELGCIRVEFKTDSRNTRSRTALARIGAVEEGTLRNHMIMPWGPYRHSTYFSITDNEWSAVRERLERRLEK